MLVGISLHECIIRSLFLKDFTDLIVRKVNTVDFQDPLLSSMAAELPNFILKSKASNTVKKYQRVFGK